MFNTRTCNLYSTVPSNASLYDDTYTCKFDKCDLIIVCQAIPKLQEINFGPSEVASLQ